MEAHGFRTVICGRIPASATAENGIVGNGDVAELEVNGAVCFVHRRYFADTVDGVDRTIPVQSQIPNGNGVGIVHGNVGRGVVEGGSYGEDQLGAVAL